MRLKTTSHTILHQISDLIVQLSDAEYSAELDLLQGNSIGKHVRHILEFFDILVGGASQGVINYDKRGHEPKFETETKLALAKLDDLIQCIQNIVFGKEVILQVCYTQDGSDATQIKSSVERELAYNIEHAIHHMAIIDIAVKTAFPKVKLPKNFGVAYSTIRYVKSMNDGSSER